MKNKVFFRNVALAFIILEVIDTIIRITNGEAYFDLFQVLCGVFWCVIYFGLSKYFKSKLFFALSAIEAVDVVIYALSVTAQGVFFDIGKFLSLPVFFVDYILITIAAIKILRSYDRSREHFSAIMFLVNMNVNLLILIGGMFLAFNVHNDNNREMVACGLVVLSNVFTIVLLYCIVKLWTDRQPKLIDDIE